MRFKFIVLALLIFGLLGCSGSKKIADNSSSSKRGSQRSKSDIKPFSKVITKDATSDEGLFNVHKVDDEYYFEIPNEILDREVLLVSRISGTIQNLSFGGAGMKARSQQVIRWQRKDDKLLLRHVSYENVANDTLPIYESVVNNNFEPVVEAFDIEALGKDSTSTVIEVTDFFTSDVPFIGPFSENQRRSFKVRRLDDDRSYIERTAAYPENVEVRHVLTYNAEDPPDNGSTNTISLEMAQSMILLPEEKMKTRTYDQRVGFFSVEQTEYGPNQQKATERQYVTRWKLLPSDMEAYKRGELVEPVEPIVYYIDRATPRKWRKYIMQGVEDWQEAFEEAGFKNAIVAKMAPTKEENPEFSPEDVRFSVIRYIANPIPNAQGPHVHDPRTGQILESDILWYHNVMALLRNWYFVQTAAANPEARTVEFEDDVMGQLIRFVSAHEVGHTLGYPHNWGSSYAFPVDSLRSPSFTSTHGTAPSIMDYARFNYIAQPGDGITNFLPAIGEYDKWVTKWGYTHFPEEDKESIEETLNEWTEERSGNPLYFYGEQTGNKIDPRAQNEDLSNDAMEAGRLGIENLKRITNNLVDWTYRKGENYEELETLYGEIINQWNRYMGHVVKNVGGVYENDKTYNQDGVVYTPTPADIQQNAVAFLNEQAFQTPEWMLNKEILNRIEHAGAVERIRNIQENALEDLLDFMRMARMIETETMYEESYSALTMLDDVRNGIWTELDTGSSIDTYRRNLQRSYLHRMHELMTGDVPDIPSQFREFFGITPVNVAQSDIRPMVREQLSLLEDEIEAALEETEDRKTRLHLQDVLMRIEQILDVDD